jgi:hypothetical protein
MMTNWINFDHLFNFYLDFENIWQVYMARKTSILIMFMNSPGWQQQLQQWLHHYLIDRLAFEL